MVISHNLLAMNAQRQFNITGNQKKKSTEKLSSGYRINRSADDAAGLAISEKMRRQIRGLDQGARNIQDGISLLQVADGALNEDHEILQRMNQLAIQAANGTNSEADRSAIQQEINQLVLELDRTANTTSFNEEIFPLRGEGTGSVIATGGSPYDSMHKVTIDLSDLSDGNYDGFSVSGNTLTITGTDFYRFTGTGEKQVRVESDATLSFEYGAGLGQPFKYGEGWQKSLIVSEGKNVTVVSDHYVTDIGLTNIVYCGSWELKDGSSLTLTTTGNQNNEWTFGTNLNQLTMGSNTTVTVSKCHCLYVMNYSGGNNKGNGKIVRADGATNITINTEQGWYGTSAVDVTSEKKDDTPVIDVDKIDLTKGGVVRSYDPFGRSPFFSSETEIILPESGYDISDELQYSGRQREIWTKKSSVDGDAVSKEDGIWIQAGAEAGQGMTIHTVDARASALGINGIAVMSQQTAGAAIDSIKGAIHKVSEYRSYFGAMQNRLEHAYNINKNVSENTQAAESQIRDTDMAEEMVELSKQNILEQMGTSMITQANQRPQGVLSLLQ